MRPVNVVSCEPDEAPLESGEFRGAAFDLTERLGAGVIGATVWEMQAGHKLGPYHYHEGVEEWMYVVSGAPVLRDRAGERLLEPGELVAFPSGPLGAHTVHGPGRVVLFSAGARGWGEAFVTVYLDSDKIGAAPGIMFRRADAIDAWPRGDRERPLPKSAGQESPPGAGTPTVKPTLIAVELLPDDTPDEGFRVRGARLGPHLAAQTWNATVYELAPGEATAGYHYKWCREEWALVLSGAPTLRHADGESVLRTGDILCFPEGPSGAHRLFNGSAATARLIVFSTSAGRPMSAFFPEDGTVLVCVSDRERFLFRHADQIEDYWDGEPGAATG